MTDSTFPPPVVVKGGKASRKDLKKLERGEGRLARRVAEAVAAVRTELGSEADGKILVPVAVVIRKKPARNKALSLFGL